MGKTRFILTLLFVLTLSSGVVAGMLVNRWPAATTSGGDAGSETHANDGPGPATTASAPRTPLGHELRLSDDQSSRMRTIWESARTKADSCYDRARDLQQRRDEAFFGLLTDEQKARYARIQEQYNKDVANLWAERETAFNDAVERTKAILDDPQKKRYDEILQSRLRRGGPGQGPDMLGPPPPPPPHDHGSGAGGGPHP
jgi:hypothetical protein